MTIITTTKTRRTPALVQDLETAKETNDLLVEVAADKTTPEAVRLNLHMALEAALGGVCRPARGFLEGTLKPATGRNPGAKGWKEEMILARAHSERMDKATGGDPEKLKAFANQFGLEHTPILNNRHERRAWAKLSRHL